MLDMRFTETQRKELLAMVRMAGWGHFLQIGEAIGTEYNVRLDNLEPDTPEYESKLKALHALSKGAKQYWASVLQVVKDEVERAEQPKPDPSTAEADTTEILDME